MGELTLLADAAGFQKPEPDASGHLLVFRTN
jgi:hypothetical protein